MVSARKQIPVLAALLGALVLSCDDESRTPPDAGPAPSAVVKPRIDVGTLAWRDGQLASVRPLAAMAEHLSFEVKTAAGTTRCTLADSKVQCGLGGRSAVQRSAEAPIWWLRTGLDLPFGHREKTGADRLMSWSTKTRDIDSYQDTHRGSYVMDDGTVLVLTKDLFTEEHALWRITSGGATAVSIPSSAQSRHADPRLVGAWLVWTTLGERHPKQVDVLAANVGATEVSERVVGSNIAGLEATHWCRHENGIRVVFASVDGPRVLIQSNSSWELVGTVGAHRWPNNDSTHLTCTRDGIWLTAGQHNESTYDFFQMKCDASGCIRGKHVLQRRPSPDFPTVPPVALGDGVLMLSTTEGESGVTMVSSTVGELGEAKATQLLAGRSVAVRRVIAHEDRALAIVQVSEDRWGVLLIDEKGTVVDAMRAAGGAVRGPRVRGDTGVRGRLAPEEIDKVVRARLGTFRSCYAKGLRDNPALAGSMTIRFVIARDGTMPSATASGEMTDAGLKKCVTDAFYGMSFPEPDGGIVTATCKLVLRRAQGAPTVRIEWPKGE